MTNYYHFLKANMTSGEGDEPPWKVGEHRQMDGEIALCERGYHGSLHPYDALQYAPGPVLCLVELTGVIIEDTDKVVAQGRRLLQAVNIERELWDFALDCAEKVLPLFEVIYPADKKPRKTIEAMRQYNAGQITRDELWAAVGAVEASARVVAWGTWAAWVSEAARATETTMARYRTKFKALCDKALAAPQDCELPKREVGDD